MSELKTCPFCGGEAKLELTTQYYTGEPEMENAFIRCMKCSVWTDEYVYATEAAAAWNTRHVETCHDKNGFDESLGFECTVCRTMVDSYMQTTCSDKREQFHYCPNCGRKVEG